MLPRPNTITQADRTPEERSEFSRKGGLTKTKKKSISSAINTQHNAMCKNCDLTCPFKPENLSKDKNHKCTIPKERFYAKFIGNKQIVNSKVLENKFYYIIGEIEEIVKSTKLFLQDNITTPKDQQVYGNQLVVLANLVKDAKTHFESNDEIGFKKDDSPLTDSKMFINLVYSVINSELDIDTAQKVIAKIHDKTKHVVSLEEEEK